MKKITLSILFLTLFIFADAQQPFSISISPSSISTMPAWQSGAMAEWNGKWIFIGGRIEGLHNFQSGSAFGTNGRNDSVFVVDPVANIRWSASARTLPVNFFESICSTNMEFYQSDSTLYMIGGFGRQDSVFSWRTFPTLTAIDLSGLVNAVIGYTSITSYFRQITDSNLAIAGGQLQKIDSTYYLVFGHRFNGVYTKDSGTTLFVQQYSNEVRKFTINDNGSALSISNYTTVQDTENFHRRDLNLIPQIFPNTDYGFTAFGGVFQKNANVPYLSPIDITASNVQVISSFNQNLNQYETAAMPVYDSINNFMHTIFFGGLSLYTYDTALHLLVQDTLVPFVNTISKVSRDGAGNLSEYKMNIEMPALLGTNAHFIPDTNISLLYNSIVNLNSITGNTHIGFIISGIHSDSANISNQDPASMSRPNQTVYDVFINTAPDGVSEIAIKNSINNLLVFPNPARDRVNIEFSLLEKTDVEVTVYNGKGELVKTLFNGKKKSGAEKLLWNLNNVASGIYFCKVKAGNSSKVVKIIVR